MSPFTPMSFCTNVPFYTYLVLHLSHFFTFHIFHLSHLRTFSCFCTFYTSCTYRNKRIQTSTNGYKRLRTNTNEYAFVHLFVILHLLYFFHLPEQAGTNEYKRVQTTANEYKRVCPETTTPETTTSPFPPFHSFTFSSPFTPLSFSNIHTFSPYTFFQTDRLKNVTFYTYLVLPECHLLHLSRSTPFTLFHLSHFSPVASADLLVFLHLLYFVHLPEQTHTNEYKRLLTITNEYKRVCICAHFRDSSPSVLFPLTGTSGYKRVQTGTNDCKRVQMSMSRDYDSRDYHVAFPPFHSFTFSSPFTPLSFSKTHTFSPYTFFRQTDLKMSPFTPISFYTNVTFYTYIVLHLSHFFTFHFFHLSHLRTFSCFCTFYTSCTYRNKRIQTSTNGYKRLRTNTNEYAFVHLFVLLHLLYFFHSPEQAGTNEYKRVQTIANEYKRVCPETTTPETTTSPFPPFHSFTFSSLLRF